MNFYFHLQTVIDKPFVATTWSISISISHVGLMCFVIFFRPVEIKCKFYAAAIFLYWFCKNYTHRRVIFGALLLCIIAGRSIKLCSCFCHLTNLRVPNFLLLISGDYKLWCRFATGDQMLIPNFDKIGCLV